MSAPSQSLLHDLFVEAIEKSPAERAAFLDAACAGDAELRASVESLLAAHDRAGRFLADPSVPAEALGEAADIPESLRELGPYTLRRVIGEGGYGTVYLAEQRQPLARSVAIKVIRSGMDTRQTIARFELERSALAMMDHPNIAKVFDAGTTPAGRPYFVMELVNGESITDYCRLHLLGLDARLSLFRQVCAAVQHAHQKGIIHRDLKPTNVLVAEHDGRPVPKVIDFGIAKAIGPIDAGENSPSLTQQAGPIGTPQYMSPEQLGDSPADIDTRADVYALGTLLYELITGSPPFDLATLRGSSDDIRRVVRETHPPKPSTRLISNAQAAAATIRRVPAELDWIAGKAMEKDRTRRYATADALAADIRRCQQHEPVAAGPPTALYRLRTFARRNRRLVAFVTFALLCLLAGSAVITVGLIREAKLRRLADQARAVADQARATADQARATADQQRNQAEAERKEADTQRLQAVANADRLFSAQQFLYLLIATPTDQAPPPPPEMLDYLARRAADGTMADHPEVLQTLHLALASHYLGQRDPDHAIVHLTAYLKLVPPGTTDANTASTLHNLALAYLWENRDADALPLLKESLAMYRSLSHGKDSIVDAPVLQHLGMVLADGGDLKSAESLLRSAIAVYDRPRQWPVMNQLADLLDREADHAAAVQMRAKADALRQSLQHPPTQPAPAPAGPQAVQRVSADSPAPPAGR